MKQDEMSAGALIARILAIRPEQYIEPEKSKGTFELTGHLMNDFEKQVYTVFRQLDAEIDQLRHKLTDKTMSKDAIGKTKAEILVLIDKLMSAKNWLYSSISDRLSMWACSLGVSKGWKIIIPDEEAERNEVVIALGAPAAFRELFAKLKNSIKDESGTDKSGTVSEMVRNMMKHQHQGSEKTH